MDDCPESARLAEDASRAKNWKRWGPLLVRAAMGRRPRGLLGQRGLQEFSLVPKLHLGTPLSAQFYCPMTHHSLRIR